MMKKTAVLAILLLTLVAVVYLFPIYWTFTTAFKTNNDIFTRPPIWLPLHLTFGNFYQKVPLSSVTTVSQTAVGSLPWLVNSLIVAIVTTLISTILIAAPAAYSLVRYIRNVWLGRLILFMTMIPEAVFVVPFFTIVNKVNLLNTWWGLILVYISFTAPFSTWLLMGFFNDIPVSVEEAAQIDGLSPFRIFYGVSLRMVTPGIVAAIILNFVTCWNELLYALVLTFSPFPTGAQTVPLFITSFIIVEKLFAWGGLAAAGIFTMLPTLILGIYAQKYLARGLTMGAVKG